MIDRGKSLLPQYSAIRVFLILIAMAHFVHLPGTAQPAESSARAVEPQFSHSTQPSSVDSGRREPGYQVFAQKIALPTITVTNQQVLVIGGTARLELGHPEQMLLELKPLSEQFAVPVPVLEAFLKRLKTNAPASGESAAEELRGSVIDYKYLLERWARYNPPAAEESVKTNALQLLQAGEIEKVWGMFHSLPRPQPPGGLRLARSG